jgi:hypothetical protein
MRHILTGVVVFVIILTLSLRLNYGLMPVGLFIAVLSALLSLLLYLIFRFILKEKKKSNYLIAIFIASVIAFISDSLISRTQLSITQSRGNGLIDSIEKYKISFGVYPDSLEQLVGNGLMKEIPSTAFFGRFDYQIDKSGGYVLMYPATLGVEATYRSKEKKWDYDD